jgi:hypothetical protein
MEETSLFLQFHRLKICTVSILGLSIIEAFVVLYLLAETGLRCDFQVFYQTAVIPLTGGLQIGVQTIAGALTDRLAFYNHIVLRVLAVTGLLIDIAMFVFAAESQYLLLGCFAVRGMIIVQLNYTVFKILKLRIENVLKYPTDHQFRIFSHFVMFAQVCAFIVTTIGVFVIPSLYLRFFNGTYTKIKYILTVVMIGLNLSGTLTSFFIPQSYYVTKEMLEGKAAITIIEEKVDDIVEDADTVEIETYEVDTSVVTLDQPEETSGINDEKQPILFADATDDLADEKFSTFFGYLFHGCIQYWTTPILWGIMVKYCFYHVAGAMMKTVLIFQLSSENENKEFPTPGNMCAGFLTNFIGMFFA